MHENAKLIYKKHVIPELSNGLKVLEIGPDAFPSTLQGLSTGLDFACWHTLDIYSRAELTYTATDPYQFDIPSESYDLVISAQVLEHVRMPWRWMPELARVTKTGGRVVTIVPVSWTYHEAPVDCWRIYPEGMRALHEEAGLETELALWESLETPQYKRSIPGNSMGDQGRRERFYKIFGPLGFPVERSYDTLAIGRKPSA